MAFYSDKHSTFRVTRQVSEGETEAITQSGRVLADLNVDIVCANTPQAKGRVERTHLTLQDRLVKELRLRNISTLEDGNAFLPEYIEAHNSKFSRA